MIFVLGLTGEISARDALHAAVMQSRGLARAMTFDRGFDRFDWIERVAG